MFKKLKDLLNMPSRMYALEKDLGRMCHNQENLNKNFDSLANAFVDHVDPKTKKSAKYKVEEKPKRIRKIASK